MINDIMIYPDGFHPHDLLRSQRPHQRVVPQVQVYVWLIWRNLAPKAAGQILMFQEVP